MNTRHIPFGSIKFDAATQVRAEIDAATVDEYAEHMEAGDKFPPADVFEADGEYYIGDGWHRLLAAQKNGDVTFPCNVQAGGRTAAIKCALGANAKHGLKRSNADKRRAVTVALSEFANLADAELARLCGVSHPFVGLMRKELQPVTVTGSESRLGADGKIRRVPTMRHEPRGEPEEKEPAEEAPPVGGSIADVEQTARDMQRTLSQAMMHAANACLCLDKIQPEDPQLNAALDRVEKHIKNIRKHAT